MLSDHFLCRVSYVVCCTLNWCVRYDVAFVDRRGAKAETAQDSSGSSDSSAFVRATMRRDLRHLRQLRQLRAIPLARYEILNALRLVSVSTNCSVRVICLCVYLSCMYILILHLATIARPQPPQPPHRDNISAAEMSVFILKSEYCFLHLASCGNRPAAAAPGPATSNAYQVCTRYIRPYVRYMLQCYNARPRIV